MSLPLASRAYHQPSFASLCPIRDAVEAMASAGVEARGAVFTRREVVDFILDLAGYTVDRPLYQLRFLEPSFGDGDFLLPAIERLIASWLASGTGNPIVGMKDAIRAVELHQVSVAHTRAAIVAMLASYDLPTAIADAWLVQDDFLLAELQPGFDIVAGNPPYIRQEMIPDVLMAEYRARYTTIFDRADIYVPFIERSLGLLTPGGNCAFICSDRWTKNRYGGPLRALVAEQFHLKTFVDMVNTPAFNIDVVAYPAITIIARDRGRATRVAHRPAIDREVLSKLASDLNGDSAGSDGTGVRELQNVTLGNEPWLLESSDQLDLVRRLEAHFPLIEDAGCKVGIGVATGADEAFIGRFADLDVEDSRKLPLAMTRDILTGIVEWRGLGVVNPFSEGGGLVDLKEYPRLARYLEARREKIARRHVATKTPANWYRTIDRIYPAIAEKPKLLIPDIKGQANIVYEPGNLYPHHNLYFITSDVWDVRALQAVLLSGIARLFVATYSTQMRGGYLRFQAQYLRRIRLPLWANVPLELRLKLKLAAENQDVEACNAAVFSLYGLSEDEQAALGGS